jgi:hypothetical protein
MLTFGLKMCGYDRSAESGSVVSVQAHEPSRFRKKPATKKSGGRSTKK